jgi:aminobenzoyl-glutamate utilization protein B
MATRSREKQFAIDWIEANRQRLSDFSMQIWHHAEPAWREYKSAKAYAELLRAEGFDVEEGSGGMPTAFMATWGSGGPVLGGYAEYDAVPGDSQQAVPYRAPREGLHPWAAGHTDPHSMLGTAGLTGMLAAKVTMEHYGLKGSLRFFGEPAEKTCGSKPVHAAKGYYDGVDAFMAYHPHPRNTTVLETQCGSYLLERRLHLRVRQPGAVDRPESRAAVPQFARRRALPGRDRRLVPDVHDDEVHQGGDVPAHRHLDPQ